MHPYVHAAKTPDKPAYIMGGSGEVVTYRQLNDRSNQAVRMLQRLGLSAGDSIAILMNNSPRFYEIAWAAHRSGLMYVTLSTKLQEEEIAYIAQDCRAKALFIGADLAPLGERLIGVTPEVKHRIAVSGKIPGYADYESLRDAERPVAIENECAGVDMLYSSGTTGRPKGIKAKLETTSIDAEHPILKVLRELYDIGADTVYLSPAPIYHGAPLRFTMGVMRAGGTVVMMEKFNAEQALQLIERYRVTHTQFVPTMFVRMLRLPEEIRRSYDVSSLKVVIHASAPCPVEVKEKMIEWWGPIIFEYYGASEGHGQTGLNSAEWLSHRGSVGRPVFGKFHILDDAGNSVPTGEIGTIWVEGGGQFEYQNDPEKTRRSINERGWRTVGDIGYLDEDGYLYLTDRRDNVIISGGVHIYPQETEDLLLSHPKVMDAAVFGVPNEEFGQEVKAVVQPVDMREVGPGLESELISFCRARLAHVKCPKTIDFESDFPRHPNGKLLKRRLRDRYWEGRRSRII